LRRKSIKEKQSTVSGPKNGGLLSPGHKKGGKHSNEIAPVNGLVKTKTKSFLKRESLTSENLGSPHATNHSSSTSTNKRSKFRKHKVQSTVNNIVRSSNLMDNDSQKSPDNPRISLHHIPEETAG
jgi:hypothetical protein